MVRSSSRTNRSSDLVASTAVDHRLVVVVVTLVAAVVVPAPEEA